MRPKSLPSDPASVTEAYATGLAMLSRRELSVVEMRRRLARKGFEAEAIEAATARLLGNGALDDRRVALAAARTHAQVKRQGRDRVARELSALGIDRSVADEALAEVFGGVDEAALLEQALDKRLRPRLDVRDPAVQRRLFGALLRQGFDGQAVSRALRGRVKARKNEDG